MTMRYGHFCPWCWEEAVEERCPYFRGPAERELAADHTLERQRFDAGLSPVAAAKLLRISDGRLYDYEHNLSRPSAATYRRMYRLYRLKPRANTGSSPCLTEPPSSP